MLTANNTLIYNMNDQITLTANIIMVKSLKCYIYVRDLWFSGTPQGHQFNNLILTNTIYDILTENCMK